MNLFASQQHLIPVLIKEDVRSRTFGVSNLGPIDFAPSFSWETSTPAAIGTRPCQNFTADLIRPRASEGMQRFLGLQGRRLVQKGRGPHCPTRKRPLLVEGHTAEELCTAVKRHVEDGTPKDSAYEEADRCKRFLNGFWEIFRFGVMTLFLLVLPSLAQRSVRN